MKKQELTSLMEEIKALVSRLERVTNGPGSGPDSGGGGPLQGTRHGTPENQAEDLGTAELNHLKEELAKGLIALTHAAQIRQVPGRVPVRGADSVTMQKAAHASDKLAQALDRAGANEADRDQVAVEIIRAIYGRRPG